MSESIREQADEREIDLGTGVDRRLLLAAGGLFVVLLAGTVAACLLGGTAAAPQHEAVVNPPPRDMATLLPARPDAKPTPRPTFSVPPPAEPVEEPVARAELKSAPRKNVVVAKYVPLPEPATADNKEKPTPQPTGFKRRTSYDEDDLRWRLAGETRDLDIETEQGTIKKLLDAPTETVAERRSLDTSSDKQPSQPKTPLLLELITQRPDLSGLPVRDVSDCQLGYDDAKAMNEMSGEVRRSISRIRRSRDIENSSLLESQLAGCVKGLKGGKWGKELGVRLLVQVFQAETIDVRMELVKTLSASEARNAGPALARLAVFDLNPELRKAAVRALNDRPRDEYRSVLFEALRHPWSPVADHAAEALVALKDREAPFQLAQLLDQPDPAAPRQDKDGKWVVPELVRVNHLANCVLCHAASHSKDDRVRGLMPERGKPLREVYYESRTGDFVRADVTYLKQDFSLMQAGIDTKNWPLIQRFDYLIRMRELTPEEVSRMAAGKDGKAQAPTIYPQRDAVLWALRELTGQDLGERSEDWNGFLRKAYSTTDK
jgi:hypothetical protein